MKSLMLASAAIMASAGAAAAQEPGTWSASAGYTNFSDDDISVGALTGRVAYRIGPHFGVEGEGSFGIFDDEFEVLGTDVTVKLNYAIGAFAVGYLPLTPQFELLGRVGYGTAEVEAEAAGFSESGDASGFAFSVGGQYFFRERLGVRAEYLNYDGEDGNLDGYSVSAVLRF